MNRVLFLLVCFVAVSCKTPCSDPKSISRIVGSNILDKWQCKNKSVAQSDLDAYFAEKNLCQKPAGKQGFLGDLVCPMLVEVIRGRLANKVPAAWGCDTSLIGSDAAGAVKALCNLIPF